MRSARGDDATARRSQTSDAAIDEALLHDMLGETAGLFGFDEAEQTKNKISVSKRGLDLEHTRDDMYGPSNKHKKEK